MKLKVGDMVRIMPTATYQKYTVDGGPMWSSDMIHHINKVVRIRKVTHPKWVAVHENGYVWLYEDLKLIDHQQRLNLKYRKHYV